MKYLILSDIHGNYEALLSVKNSVPKSADGLIMLGDIIDYGPHSNEVIDLLRNWDIPLLCNIRGNHEQALVCDMMDRFSSDRGRKSSIYVKEHLNDSSWNYLNTCMSDSGCMEFSVNNKKCLAVHGSLDDMYWKSIDSSDELECYRNYDYVFSGHSHIPYIFSKFYKTNDALYRNKKRTLFINPGSVGQPRNHNSCAQYVVWDTDTDAFELKAVKYDIKKEQEAFPSEIDVFYRDRLEIGV